MRVLDVIAMRKQKGLKHTIKKKKTGIKSQILT